MPDRRDPATYATSEDRGRAPEPLLRAPTLRTEETRAASPLELFFDLAFVLAVAELAGVLSSHLDLTGVAEFTGLYALVWLSWAQITLYANRFDTDDLLYRAGMFVAMAGVLGSAASMSDALGAHLTAFTLSYLLGRLVLVGMYARAWFHVVEARATLRVYLLATTAVAVLWAVSLLVPTPWVLLVWGVAAVIDLGAPALASRGGGHAPLHLEHLPERFGLLVILVLGELTAATVAGVHETGWARVPLLIGVAGFVLAAALWWTYFDIGAVVSAQALQRAEDESREQAPDADESSDERHDFFVYAHLPITAGVVAAATGIEHLVAHPDEALPSVGSWCLTLGLVAFVVGSVVVQGGARRDFRRAAAWPGAVVPVLLAVGWWGAGSPVTLAALMAAAMVATAAVGTVLSRAEHWSAEAR